MTSCCDDKQIYPVEFTVGDALPNIAMTYHAPDPDGAGLSFEMLITKPDGTCSIIPGSLISSDANQGKYSFEWLFATKSTVNLDVTLEDSATLPAGSRAANDNGDVFVTTAPITNPGPGQATLSIGAEAEVVGAVSTTAGTITTIETPVTGWVAVNNPLDGVDGIDDSLVEGMMQEVYIRVTNSLLQTQHLGPVFINVRERPCP